MVKIFCKLCLQYIAATDWKSHVAQKQHLQELPAKIVVKGPFKQDEIHRVFEHFVKFGGIRGQSVTNSGNNVSIEYRFWDARVYSEIIHQEHTVCDNEIEISWFKKSKSGDLLHVLPDDKMRKEKFIYRKIAIINSFKELPTFDEQLTLFQNKLKVTKTQTEANRKLIYNDLAAALVTNFPQSMIHFFGSSVTDLDIHDSDLNIYVDNTDSQLATLERIKEQVERSEFFERVSLCLDGDSPVVKFEHKKTKIFCQVSIKNELPVGNTELIKFYLMLDEKLKPLIVLIKFWLDCCGLRHENGLSSYAICLMVLFYLQQDPYNLPSVADLQTDLPPDEVDGWNCAFGPVEFTSSSLENATIFELMVGFLEFYSKFDYASTVLSPYWGSAIEKIGFLKPYELPDCFENFVNSDEVFVVNSGICVQDVFEHSKNVSLSVDLSSGARFTAVCRKSLELARSNAKGILFKLLASDEDLNEFSVINDDFCDEHEWIGLIKSLVSTILKRICRCDIVEKIEETGVCYDCSGDFNVWDDRVQTLKNLPVDRKINTVEREVAVSSHIVNNSSKEATWKMAVSLKFDTNPSRVSISFKDEENLPLILHIQHFVYVRLLEALKHKVKICIDDSDNKIFVAKDEPIVSEKVTKKDPVDEIKIEKTSTSKDCGDTQVVTNQNETVPTEVVNLDTNTQAGVDPFLYYQLRKKSFLTFEKQVNFFYCRFHTSKTTLNEMLHAISADLGPMFEYKLCGSGFLGTHIPKSDINIQIYDTPVVKFHQFLVANDRFAHVALQENCIKCVHLTTNLKVTFTPRNYTYELLAHYAYSDEKIRFLITVVKHWAHSCHIIHTITGYMITLMVLFYLQVVHKLPAMAAVQKTTTPKFKNNWKKIAPLKKSNFDLIVGFFKFYGDFDYFSMVVAPFCGIPIAKSRFLKPFSLPEQYQCYAKQDRELVVDSGMCIQCPFEHTRNVSASVRYSTAARFAGLCRYADRQLTKKNLLADLFWFSKNCQRAKFGLKQPAQVTLDKWIDSVKNFVVIILTQVLGGKIVHEANLGIGGITEYKCEGPLNVLDNRVQTFKKISKDLQPDISYLDREVALTSQILQNSDVNRWQIGVQIIVKKTLSVGVLVSFSGPLELCFCHFVYTRLCKLLSGEQNSKRAEATNKNVDNKNVLPVSGGSKFSSDEVKRTCEDALPSSEEQKKKSPPAPSMEGVEAGSSLSLSDDKMQTSILSPSETQSEFKKIPIKISLSAKDSSKKKTVVSTDSTPTSASDSDQPKLAILQETQNLPTFAAQTSHFCTKLLQDEKTTQARQCVIERDLKNALVFKAPYKKIFFFGSSVTGLVTEGGSFDIHVTSNSPRNKLTKTIVDALVANSKFEKPARLKSFVHCRHTETKVNCHVYINEELLTSRSRLVEYYVSLSPKVRQLFFVIKCWWEFNNVKENANLSKYGLYLMVIFYLQQEPYYFPSVSNLQERANPELVGDWNVAFVPLKFTSQALEAATINDLVFGFFQFYSTFDFYYNVVAPYSGSAIPKVCFVKPFDLPPCYDLLVKSGFTMTLGFGTWVQDPFQHTENIADSKNIQCVGKFSTLCRGVVEVDPSEKQLLHRLMVQCNNIEAVEIVKKPTFEEQTWKQTVKNVLFTIITKILCCEVIDVQESTLSRVPPVKDKPQEKEQTTIVCRGTKEIWSDRIAILKSWQPDTPSSCFNMDLFVSSVIKNDNQRNCEFDLTIKVVFLTNPTSVRVTILQPNLSHFNHFLYTRIVEGVCVAELKRQIHSPLQTSPIREHSKSATKVCESYKILVKGKFTYAQICRVHDYFSKFGKIVDVKVLGQEKNLAVEYCFAESDVYFQVIQKEHCLFGYKLKIVPLVALSATIPTLTFEDRKLSIIYSTVKCSTFEQQVNRLWNRVNSREEKIEKKYQTILSDFRTVLSDEFGSSNVSLGPNIGGNLEVYIENVTDAALKVAKHLLNTSPKFSFVSYAPRPNNFITCQHDQMKVKCDLRIRNTLVTSRHRLIQYYLSLDSKVPKLVLLLKYWVDYYDLADAFSDDAVSLLVIFYLQQGPYSLPSVKNLQSSASPQIVDGWNCAYAEIPEFTNSVLKYTPILDLLSDFFKFYSNFDYVTYVISPYFGSPVQKIRFLKPYALPPGFNYFRTHGNDLSVTSGVFVQDFFQHSLNLTNSATLDCMGRFTHVCRKSLQVLNSPKKFLLGELMLIAQRSIFDNPEFQITKKVYRDEVEWVQTTQTLTAKILSDVLNYKLSTKPTGFECVGQNNVWDSRIKAMKTLGMSRLRGVEKEAAVTTQVIIGHPEEVTWRLFVDLIFTTEPCGVKVVFKLNPGFNVYHVCHFLYTRLGKFLDNVEDCLDVVEVEECDLAEEVVVIDLTDDGDVKVQPETSDCSEIEVNTGKIETEEKPPDTSDTIILDETKNEETPDVEDTKHKDTPSRKRKRSNVYEEEDDDVPSDFFDDFANEDFLDGLEIVDACDDKSTSDKVSSESDKEKSLTNEPRKVKPRMRSKSRSRSKSRDRSMKRSRGKDSPEYRSRRHRTPTKPKIVYNVSPSTPKRGKRSESREYRPRRRARTPTRTNSTRPRSRTPSPCDQKRRRSSDYRRRKPSSSSDDARTRLQLQNALLEEIKRKINEVRPVQPMPTPHISLSIPPAHSQHPVKVQIYDNTAFVGNANPTQAFYPQPVFRPQLISPPIATPSPKTAPFNKNPEEDLVKLLKEGRLSLTDYLMTAATPKASSSTSLKHLREKVKVLCHCQDIIKFLKPDQGRLIRQNAPPKQRKYQSPLRTALALRFRFTSLPERPVKDPYSDALCKVLQKGGIEGKFGDKENQRAVDKVTEALEALKKALSDAVDK
ncbi:uncharacterized protein LOC135140929 isoform X3 [Zophobas morio]|uniref:uncharacterized protein LOC135140929 isoform X3 n=1 Tax=Zophobas morio TaxID=2755281 RepID=UPI003082B92D